jgi:hypothetical protein
MKKIALLEIDSVRCKILEDKVDEKTGLSTITAEVKWQAADLVNANKRLYPRAILAREIAKLNPKIAEGEIFGAAFHPEKAAEIPDVSHVWRSIAMESSGECTGIVEVLPTTRGKDVQIVMRAGKIGLSSRGSGTFSSKERKLEDGSIEKYDEINEDYHLASPGDFVLTPSVYGAGIKRIIEARYEETDVSDSKGKDSTMNEEQMKQRIVELEQQLADEKAKIVVLEAKVAEKEVALTEQAKAAETLVAKADEAEKAKAKLVEYLRSMIMGASEIPGVIPESAKVEKVDPPPAAVAVAVVDADGTKQIEQLKAEATRLQSEIDAMKKIESDAKEADEAAKAKTTLQAAIKEAFDATVGKPDYKAFETIIRKELVNESGEILIESVELVEERVKAVQAKTKAILVEAERAKIVSTFGEKGQVGNPDTPQTNEQTLKLRQGFREALVSGFNGTFEAYIAKVSPKK